MKSKKITHLLTKTPRVKLEFELQNNSNTKTSFKLNHAESLVTCKSQQRVQLKLILG